MNEHFKGTIKSDFGKDYSVQSLFGEEFSSDFMHSYMLMVDIKVSLEH